MRSEATEGLLASCREEGGRANAPERRSITPLRNDGPLESAFPFQAGAMGPVDRPRLLSTDVFHDLASS